jgi:peptidoglycan/LPS O-acetylase OafA/YrhL
MKKHDTIYILSSILVIADGLIWIGFSLLTALGMIPGLDPDSVFRWGMTILAFFAGTGLLVLLRFSRRSRFAHYLLLTALALIAILSVTDQIGLLDLAAFALNLLAFVLLLLDRSSYPGQKTSRG